MVSFKLPQILINGIPEQEKETEMVKQFYRVLDGLEAKKVEALLFKPLDESDSEEHWEVSSLAAERSRSFSP